MEEEDLADSSEDVEEMPFEEEEEKKPKKKKAKKVESEEEFNDSD